MKLKLLVILSAILFWPVVVEAESFAFVNLSAASLRSQPSHAAELETQAVYGTPLELLDEVEEWLRVRTPDGYEAWIPQSSVVVVGETDMNRWRSAERVIVTRAYSRPVVVDTLKNLRSVGNIVSDLSLGAVLEGRRSAGSEYFEVVLPDGRRGYALSADFEDFKEWASRAADPDEIVTLAAMLNGVPYLWGGVTEKGLDCSGLSQSAYLLGGRLLLPRNASQQARIGTELDPSNPELFEKGDLLFFGSDGRITHVAIYDEDQTYLHSSGRVHRGSFDPEHPLYIPRDVVRAVRILSDPATLSRFVISGNPFYF